MKVCKKCDLEKEETLFNKGRGECKECMSKYKKEYAIKNAEKISEYQSKFRNENSEYLKEYQKNYRENKKEDIKIYKKEYAINNSEKINSYLRERYKKQEVKDKYKDYRDKNKERYKEYSRLYYILHKEEIILNNYQNKKKRIKNDDLFALYIRISGSIRDSIIRDGYKKKSKSQEILGCSFDEFKLYLESKFEPWMNWENRGLYNGEVNYGWDIDHIIPVSSANSEEELIKLNHYTNLQPLCSYTNRVIKRDRYDD